MAAINGTSATPPHTKTTDQKKESVWWAAKSQHKTTTTRPTSFRARIQAVFMTWDKHRGHGQVSDVGLATAVQAFARTPLPPGPLEAFPQFEDSMRRDRKGSLV